MARFAMLVTTAVMTLLPSLAMGTTYTFDATETSALSPSPVNFSFALDTAAAVVGVNGTTFSNIAIDQNGKVFPANSVGVSYTTNLSSALFFFIDTDTRPFYSGAGSSLVFNSGTFAIADGATDGEGTLIIREVSGSAVPEPATWVLLLGGLLLPMVLRRASTRRKLVLIKS